MTDQTIPDNCKPATTGRGTGKITPKLRRFAREYHLSGNGAESAIKAGYSEKSAAQQAVRLLTYANVQAELARLEVEAAARYNMTLDGLLGMSFNIHDLALEGTPIMNRHNEVVLKDGEPLIKRDLTNANKAIEHIAKLTGFMIEKRDVVTRRHLDDMDDAELKAEGDKIQAEIDKLKKAEVVELHVVDGGNDSETPAAG